MREMTDTTESFFACCLRCEAMENPLGIDTLGPRLSWQIRSVSRDFLQSAYQVQTASDRVSLERGEDLLWDSGKVTGRSAFADYAGPDTLSRQRYCWRVRCWDRDGAVSDWSDPAYWEMGLLEPGDWRARWIEPDQQPVSREEPIDIKKIFAGVPVPESSSCEVLHPCPYLRREFTVKNGIKSARIYATAHGLYKLELNGQRVGDRELTPEFTSYDKYLQYQTYDVTALLSPGKSAVGAILADGWYAGRAGLLGDSCLYGDRLGLLLQLELVYEDGSRETVASDGGFRSSCGPLRYADLFMGEKYDAREELGNWSSPGYDDSEWKPVAATDCGLENLRAQYGEPVRAVMELKPAGVFLTPKGEWVVDMGQNMAGRVRMRVSGPAGAQVTLEHSEVLDSGGNFHNNIKGRNRNQTDVYIQRGGSEEVYEPVFTYHGFRYVRVTGFPGIPTAEDFTGVVLSSELKSTGSFCCSDSRLNRLQENIVWSQRSNMLSIPTDCPHRERAGWTGDIQVFAPTACFNMDMSTFLTRWLRNVVGEQRPDGQILTIVPNMLRTYDDASLPIPGGLSSAGWGDACIIVPWVLYSVYGDERVLRENYGAMAGWVAYLEKAASAGKPESGYLLNTGFHFGDWLVPSICDESGKPDSMRSAFITKDLVATCFFAYSAGLLGQIAKILGRPEDAERYEALGRRIREAYAAEYLQEDGTLRVELQGIYVLALKMEMVPEAMRERVFSQLVRLIEKSGGRLDTGFVSTPFLLDVLTQFGRSDLAYDLLFQTECPSWLYEVEKGATTIWESWRAILPDGTVTDISYNHYALGCVGDWLHRTVAGLQSDSQGFRHIVIQPQPDERLDFADAQYDSVCGRVASRWERAGNTMTVSVTIPPNTAAAVWLPGADAGSLADGGKPVTEGNGIHSVQTVPGYTVLEVGSGEYDFTYSLAGSK